MRPNIQITHQKNGVVKDLAAEHDMTVEEMYREIIDIGIEAVESGALSDNDDDPDGTNNT